MIIVLLDLVRRMSFEAMLSTGITVDFYRCNSSKSDLYQDPDCTWDPAIQVSCIFEDNPKVKILKNLGWYNEDEEIRPPIIYLPMYIDWESKKLFDVTSNSLVRVHYFGQNTPSEFRITERKMDSVYGVYWVCKLSPERLNKFEEVRINGTHFLKRKDRDDGCIHDKENNDSDSDFNGDLEHEDYENYLKKSNNEEEYYDMIMGGIDE